MYRCVCVNTIDAKSAVLLGTWGRSFMTTTKTCNQSAVNFFRFKLRSARVPDAVQSPRLTPQMVNSILRMNEELIEENNGPIKFIVKNHLQVRTEYMYTMHCSYRFVKPTEISVTQ
jgi:hypothetical protein